MAKKILMLTGGGHIDFSKAIAETVSYAETKGYEVYAGING